MSETQVFDWESRYQAGRTAWERPALNPAFLAWRESGELAPCRILIPGAGRSAEPAVLAAAGFEVTVLDVAQTATAAQRQQLGSMGCVVEADLFAWQPDVPFDAVYEQTCLCAVPPALMREYEQLLARWVRPGGTLFALFMQSGKHDGPPFDCAIPHMRTLFAPDRWTWPASLPALVQHPSLFSEQPAVLGRRLGSG